MTSEADDVMELHAEAAELQRQTNILTAILMPLMVFGGGAIVTLVFALSVPAGN